MLKLQQQITKFIEDKRANQTLALSVKEHGFGASTNLACLLAAFVQDDDLWAVLNNVRQIVQLQRDIDKGVEQTTTTWEHKTFTFSTWGAAHYLLDRLAEERWEVVGMCGTMNGSLSQVNVTCRRRRAKDEGLVF